ncbi:hypothetical protein DFH08DRAFT_809191 [Mycena albidolilacea]|uniref:Uncharacterized protein n=1 Tax=Mycena albidolilacea TaxID=1033008 RepID=A0AAD7A162_9AGAR|nr:hypothetical protein DFH08DRAFT_809191 [Mycena albidolilacea]
MGHQSGSIRPEENEQIDWMLHCSISGVLAKLLTVDGSEVHTGIVPLNLYNLKSMSGTNQGHIYYDLVNLAKRRETDRPGSLPDAKRPGTVHGLEVEVDNLVVKLLSDPSFPRVLLRSTSYNGLRALVRFRRPSTTRRATPIEDVEVASKAVTGTTIIPNHHTRRLRDYNLLPSPPLRSYHHLFGSTTRIIHVSSVPRFHQLLQEQKV